MRSRYRRCCVVGLCCPVCGPGCTVPGDSHAGTMISLALRALAEPMVVPSRRAIASRFMCARCVLADIRVVCARRKSNPRCDPCICFYCVVRLCCFVRGLAVLWEVYFICAFISYVLDRYWSNPRHLLCVRLPCATAVLPCTLTCRTMCTGILCYPLHSTWDSRACVPLSSVVEPLYPHLGSIVEP